MIRLWRRRKARTVEMPPAPVGKLYKPWVMRRGGGRIELLLQPNPYRGEPGPSLSYDLGRIEALWLTRHAFDLQIEPRDPHMPYLGDKMSGDVIMDLVETLKHLLQEPPIDLKGKVGLFWKEEGEVKLDMNGVWLSPVEAKQLGHLLDMRTMEAE